MIRGSIVSVLLASALSVAAAQADVDRAYAAFTMRLDSYVQMHRRIEGPVSPLLASPDLAEVRRLMSDVRRRIKAESTGEQGRFFTPDVTLALRKRIATVMTRTDVQALVDDVAEHTLPGLPPIRVYEALPADAPFVQIPPPLFKVLPALPSELRYVVLGKGLVLWDHHADLVIDHVPGLFNPRAFWTRTGS
jgi:hypothetical protein